MDNISFGNAKLLADFASEDDQNIRREILNQYKTGRIPVASQEDYDGVRDQLIQLDSTLTLCENLYRVTHGTRDVRLFTELGKILKLGSLTHLSEGVGTGSIIKLRRIVDSVYTTKADPELNRSSDRDLLFEYRMPETSENRKLEIKKLLIGEPDSQGIYHGRDYQFDFDAGEYFSYLNNMLNEIENKKKNPKGKQVGTSTTSLSRKFVENLARIDESIKSTLDIKINSDNFGRPGYYTQKTYEASRVLLSKLNPDAEKIRKDAGREDAPIVQNAYHYLTLDDEWLNSFKPDFEKLLTKEMRVLIADMGVQIQKLSEVTAKYVKKLKNVKDKLREDPTNKDVKKQYDELKWLDDLVTINFMKYESSFTTESVYKKRDPRFKLPGKFYRIKKKVRDSDIDEEHELFDLLQEHSMEYIKEHHADVLEDYNENFGTTEGDEEDTEEDTEGNLEDDFKDDTEEVVEDDFEEVDWDTWVAHYHKGAVQYSIFRDWGKRIVETAGKYVAIDPTMNSKKLQTMYCELFPDGRIIEKATYRTLEVPIISGENIPPPRAFMTELPKRKLNLEKQGFKKGESDKLIGVPIEKQIDYNTLFDAKEHTELVTIIKNQYNTFKFDKMYNKYEPYVREQLGEQFTIGQYIWDMVLPFVFLVEPWSLYEKSSITIEDFMNGRDSCISIINKSTLFKKSDGGELNDKEKLRIIDIIGKLHENIHHIIKQAYYFALNPSLRIKGDSVPHNIAAIGGYLTNVMGYQIKKDVKNVTPKKAPANAPVMIPIEVNNRKGDYGYLEYVVNAPTAHIKEDSSINSSEMKRREEAAKKIQKFVRGKKKLRWCPKLETEQKYQDYVKILRNKNATCNQVRTKYDHVINQFSKKNYPQCKRLGDIKKAIEITYDTRCPRPQPKKTKKGGK